MFWMTRRKKKLVAFSKYKQRTSSLPLLQLANQADPRSCLSRKRFLATMPFISRIGQDYFHDNDTNVMVKRAKPELAWRPEWHDDIPWSTLNGETLRRKTEEEHRGKKKHLKRTIKGSFRSENHHHRTQKKTPWRFCQELHFVTIFVD